MMWRVYVRTGGLAVRYFGKALIAVAVACTTMAVASIQPASADIFNLANSNGGDGFVTLSPGGFDLFGADNGASQNYTTYTATALTSQTFTVNWAYTTNDCCGSVWDPAGYVINGVYTQLSTDSSVQGQVDSNGSFTVSVLAGDVYGMYVYSPDSVEGRGDISVSVDAGTTPLPAALPLLATGIGGLGLVCWRKKRKPAARAV